MTFRTDPSKSMEANFADMVNSAAQFVMEPDEFTGGAISSISPNTSNGNANTQCTITASPTGRLEGSSTVQWARINAMDNVAGLLTGGFASLKIRNGMTHADIQAAILKKFKIPPEEVTWPVMPATVPGPGVTAEYRMHPSTLNKFFLSASGLRVNVTNVDDLVNLDSSYFFGTPVAANYNGKKVYSTGTGVPNYVKYPEDGKQSFLNLVNEVYNTKKATLIITKDMVDIGEPIAFQVVGAQNTLVRLTPKPGCPFLDECYISYPRSAFSGSGNNISSGNLEIRFLTGVDAFHAWMKIVHRLSLDECRFISITGAVGSSRTLVVSNDHVAQPYGYLSTAGNVSISITY